MTFVAGGKYFIDRETWHRFPEGVDSSHRFGRFRPSLIRLGHDPGYSTTMSGDDDSLAPFHGIKELRQVRLGLGGLNFAHGGTFNWSNRLVEI